MRTRVRRLQILGVILVVLTVPCVVAFLRPFRESEPIRIGEELTLRGHVVVKGDRSSNYAELYRDAAALVAQGRLHEAENLNEEILRKEPNSPDALVNLASSYCYRGEFTGARQLYEQALEIEPRSVNARLGLVQSMVDSRNMRMQSKNTRPHWRLTGIRLKPIWDSFCVSLGLATNRRHAII